MGVIASTLAKVLAVIVLVSVVVSVVLSAVPFVDVSVIDILSGIIQGAL